MIYLRNLQSFIRWTRSLGIGLLCTHRCKLSRYFTFLVSFDSISFHFVKIIAFGTFRHTLWINATYFWTLREEIQINIFRILMLYFVFHVYLSVAILKNILSYKFESTLHCVRCKNDQKAALTKCGSEYCAIFSLRAIAFYINFTQRKPSVAIKRDKRQFN